MNDTGKPQISSGESNTSLLIIVLELFSFKILAKSPAFSFPKLFHAKSSSKDSSNLISCSGWLRSSDVVSGLHILVSSSLVYAFRKLRGDWTSSAQEVIPSAPQIWGAEASTT